MAALQSGERAVLVDTLATSRLADAVDRPAAPALGPERQGAFRDALTAEILRDDWRALYTGASIARVESKPPHNPVVVVTLDGGVERRAEVAADNGQARIVRVY